MVLRSLRLIFLLPGLLLSIISDGQADSFPIDQWISSLSVKEGKQSPHFVWLVREFHNLDSVTTCELLEKLREEGPRNNLRYKVRLDILQSIIQLHLNDCTGQRPLLDILKGTLKDAYELGDEELIFLTHKAFVQAYSSQLNYSLATLHALIAIELAEKLEKEQLYVGVATWYKLGYVLYHSREYEAAIRASKMSVLLPDSPIPGPEDPLIPFYQMSALNTVGLCYKNLGKPDSAFLAFDEAMKRAILGKYDFWYGLIRGNKGDVYYQIGQYDSAEACLLFDYEKSVAAKQFDNASNSLQWLARLKLRDGNAFHALGMLREATSLHNQIPNPTYKANILYAYTQVFSALGKADSMNTYMHQYLTLNDSIESAASNNRIEIVQMRLDNQANVNKIISLNKEKKSIAMIRNFIIALIILLAITGFTILNRQKLNLKFRQLQALEEKRQAEQESEHAKAQLDIFTRQLVEKTNLLETLQEQLMHRELNDEQMVRISELSHHSILTEEDWEQFKSIFDKVYPGFFHTLKQQSTDITVAELRMAALCKLQILPKEAANMLGISHNSVNKNRQRLRSRLGLDPDTDLELYFSAF